jgi:GNAT superfamily N-acetyltransferase
LTLTALPDKQNKNYDACEGASPDNWSKTFDTTNWGYIVARDADKRIGGAVIAYNTDAVNILDGRSDLAVLWDIRIDSPYRHKCVGHKLFAAVEDWARERHCKQLKIETQNINVAACQFYLRQGCTIGAINRFAYPGLPHESQLIWYKDL